MLLIVFTVAILVVGIFLNTFVNEKFYSAEIASIASVLIICCACFALVIEIVVLGVQYIDISGQIAACEQKYESLVFQLENNLYDNDNDFGKKELYNQIQNWNEDLARGKAMQDDIWVGAFWPNIYDDFEFIELEAQA